MTDVKVEQCDVEAAEQYRRGIGGGYDREVANLAFSFARHRQAAEKATRERDAGIAEDRMPVIQCMSVEPVVSACRDIATAIRSQNDD